MPSTTPHLLYVYRYSMTLPRPDRHGHRVYSGNVRSGSRLDAEGVEALAKKTSHGVLAGARLDTWSLESVATRHVFGFHATASTNPPTKKGTQ
jgi:hypothetical protein